MTEPTKTCSFFLLFSILWILLYSTASADDSSIFKNFTFSGFIEMDNHFNTHTDQEFHNSVKKNELRTKLKLRLGEDNSHIFISPDFRISSALFKSDDNTCAYTDRHTVARNGRLSDRGYEITANEAYVHLSNSNARIRIGNQLYGWGTADVFNPTSYFNPYDMRETFFKSDDSIKQGVPSVSGMFFLKNLTVEAVWVPFHVPAIIAEDGRYWKIDMDNYQLPILFDNVRARSRKIVNSGLGIRASATVLGTDLSVSAYHGPDKDLLYHPEAIITEPDKPVSVWVIPESHPVTFFGFDISKSLDSFVFQAELAISPDKRTCIEQDTGEPSSIMFPYEIKKSVYMAWAMGFNYFIPLHRLIKDHEGDTVLTVEWYKTAFLEKNRTESVISDIISTRFQDTFFKGHIPVSVTCLVSVKKPGYVFWPEIGYDFQNGFRTSLAFTGLNGRSRKHNSTESLFYYFRKNDTLIWNMHYDF